MKPNIDLTEGRDFPDQTLDARDVLFGGNRGRIPQLAPPDWARHFFIHSVPWEFKELESDKDFGFTDNLFPTGSRKEILHKLGVETAISDKHCDRCGKEINAFPWKRYPGLCQKCEDILNKEFNGKRGRMIPWERNDTMITLEDIW